MPPWGYDEPLPAWERELLSGCQRDVAVATFTRTDKVEVVVRDVDVDSIGPAGDNPYVIAVEFVESDRILHLPFIESWEISYE